MVAWEDPQGPSTLYLLSYRQFRVNAVAMRSSYRPSRPFNAPKPAGGDEEGGAGACGSRGRFGWSGRTGGGVRLLGGRKEPEAVMFSDRSAPCGPAGETGPCGNIVGPVFPWASARIPVSSPRWVIVPAGTSAAPLM